MAKQPYPTDIYLRKDGRTWGVYVQRTMLDAELLEGGFFTREAAWEACKAWRAASAKAGLERPLFAPGTLVALTGIGDPGSVKRIARVVEDKGRTVVIETDAEIEGDAAIEFDFPTPDQETFEVAPDRLMRIL